MAALLGKEAGLWVPTCGMANLVALLTIAPRGSTVVLEASSHVLTSEAMGIEEIAGLEPWSLWAEDGRLDPAEVEELIVETGALMLVLENTHTRAGGTVLSPELTAELAAAAQSHGAYVHLDGARLFNAAVALGVPVQELAAKANTVAVSMNKGLCAPMGAILAGRTQVIELAHETLRRLGGASVHKAGIAAAAALVALDTLVERLADDHRRARELGALLQEIPGLEVEPAEIETNIVLVDVSGTELYPDDFLELLAERGVLGLERDTTRIRFVTHRLIEDADIARAAELVALTAAEALRLVAGAGQPPSRQIDLQRERCQRRLWHESDTGVPRGLVF